MIKVARWKIFAIFAICLWGILFSLPNIMSDHMREQLPSFMQKTINLGLELQGGSHIQMEVDLRAVHKDWMNAIMDDVRTALRKEKIGYTDLKVSHTGNAHPTQTNGASGPSSSAHGLDGAYVEFSLREGAQVDQVRKILAKLDKEWMVTPVTGASGSTVLRIALSPEIQEKRNKLVIEQSIEVVRRRVDESGTKEPIIQAQGDDRIILQLPGVSDPAEVKKLLGKTAKMTFRAVDDLGDIQVDAQGRPTVTIPADAEVLVEMDRDRQGQEYKRHVVVKKQVHITGDQLVDSQVSMDEHGRPAVGLKFNAAGARKFAEMTKKYLNKRFAIVLDNVVVTSPRFTVVIQDGQSVITGSFTIKDAHETALLLRAGALPAPLKVIEERTVGPSLGADSIQDGRNATILAFVLISVFMVLNYSLFGAFANIALTFNVILLFAALSLLQATLTLPGIAAIALSMGMAVDANVLIYERIKEEIRNGLRPVAAIEAGYNRAMTTIIDSNLTTMIGSAVLFEFGTGPIRGFAVNLALGILISMFTAIALTKLVVAKYIGRRRPKRLPI